MGRDRRDKRELILREAIKVFGEKGYAGGSLEEIAEQVGLTKAAIYYYFRNKQELYNSIFREKVEGIQFNLTGEPKRDLREYIRQISKLFRDRSFAKIFASELSLGMINLTDETLKKVARLLQTLSEILYPWREVNPFFVQTLIVSSTITYYNTLEVRERISRLLPCRRLDPHFNLRQELERIIFNYLEQFPKVERGKGVGKSFKKER
jgi:AcrR family transcriptional regulator